MALKTQVYAPRRLATEGMRTWLGRTAREMRERQGVTMMDIATRAGVDESVISLFERGLRWPRKTDEIVAAYAHELGIKPGVTLGFVGEPRKGDTPPHGFGAVDRERRGATRGGAATRRRLLATGPAAYKPGIRSCADSRRPWA